MIVAKALVLAAGNSTRLQGVQPDRPKPLIEVAGRPVIEHNVRALARAGVGEIWVNLHYKGDQIERFLGDGSRYGLVIRYSREPQLLGTAGAARRLVNELSGSTFAVVYGDNLVSVDFVAMMRVHRESRALATIAVFDPRTTLNSGIAGGRVVVDDEGRVSRFQEGTGDGSLVNAGVYLLEPDVLGGITPAVVVDFGHDVFPALIDGGARIQAYTVSGHCLAVDTPEALRRAQEIVNALPHAQFDTP